MIRLPTRRSSPRRYLVLQFDRLAVRRGDWGAVQAGYRRSPKAFLRQLGEQFWGGLFAVLLGEAAQPQVREWRDRHGQSGYKIYDPYSGKTHHFETMTETRAWLESRYYR